MPQMPEDRPEETEHERTARLQKEAQAREGQPEQPDNVNDKRYKNK
jgi:hypothetical protein